MWRQVEGGGVYDGYRRLHQAFIFTSGATTRPLEAKHRKANGKVKPNVNI